MTGLTKVQFETFAQGVAGGMTVPEAAEAASYLRCPSTCYRRAKKDDFKARVAAIRAEPPWWSARDVESLLRALGRAYDGAMADKSYEAAGRIVVMAAKLALEPGARRAPDSELSDAEWLKYGPKS